MCNCILKSRKVSGVVLLGSLTASSASYVAQNKVCAYYPFKYCGTVLGGAIRLLGECACVPLKVYAVVFDSVIRSLKDMYTLDDINYSFNDFLLFIFRSASLVFLTYIYINILLTFMFCVDKYLNSDEDGKKCLWQYLKYCGYLEWYRAYKPGKTHFNFEEYRKYAYSRGIKPENVRGKECNLMMSGTEESIEKNCDDPKKGFGLFDSRVNRKFYICEQEWRCRDKESGAIARCCKRFETKEDDMVLNFPTVKSFNSYSSLRKNIGAEKARRFWVSYLKKVLSYNLEKRKVDVNFVGFCIKNGVDKKCFEDKDDNLKDKNNKQIESKVGHESINEKENINIENNDSLLSNILSDSNNLPDRKEINKYSGSDQSDAAPVPYCDNFYNINEI